MGGDLNDFRDITHFMKWRGYGMPPGDPPPPLGSMVHVTKCASSYGTRIYMVYGVGIWTVSKILCILLNEGGGPCTGGPPGLPRSISLNVPYHKEQAYIGLGREFWTLSKLLCIFTFSHTNAYATKFDLGLKVGQGHPRVTIYAIYDGPTSQMLHTKFHANRPSGSGEEFWRVFTIYGYGGHLGHVT